MAWLESNQNKTKIRQCEKAQCIISGAHADHVGSMGLGQLYLAILFTAQTAGLVVSTPQLLLS